MRNQIFHIIFKRWRHKAFFTCVVNRLGGFLFPQKYDLEKDWSTHFGQRVRDFQNR